MNHSEIEVLKAHLRNRISELQELEKERRENLAEEQAAADQETAPDTVLGRRFVEKDKQELARLRANLLWLAGDSGGCCERCGCEIPIPRLRAVPVTRLCVKCAGAGG